MWFEGKFVSQITVAEIQRLVDDHVCEDEEIDFKSEPYGGDSPSDKKRVELCSDVVSFANASGGYVVIGVRDRNNCAAGLAPISDPLAHVERIRKTCLDGIDPRIDDLDVGSVQVESSGYVIVVRVPDGAQKPYMVKTGRLTKFCRRYGSDTREMSYAEIRDQFRSDLTERRLSVIDTKIDALLAITEQRAVAQLGPDNDVLAARTPDEIDQIMEARLRAVAAQ